MTSLNVWEKSINNRFLKLHYLVCLLLADVNQRNLHLRFVDK